jgi:NAD+ synthase (glutamine-hydrolysing)
MFALCYTKPKDCFTWQSYLDIYRNKTKFDAKRWIEKKCVMFNEYLLKHGLTGAVLSVSGGIDSAVTLALLRKTMELPNSNLKKVLALNQPIHSSNWAHDRAEELCKSYNIPLVVIDQTDIHRNLVQKFDMYDHQLSRGNEFSKGQLRSYLRTPANYYGAQLLSQEGFPAVVVGTGNMDEDGYLAYFCKYGDGAVDIQLIADLHKSQVFTIGKELNVVESILEAKPSADLWDGQTDEEEMGFSYDFVEFFTGYYLKLNESERKRLLQSLTETSRIEFNTFSEKCKKIHQRNQHKLGGVINL